LVVGAALAETTIRIVWTDNADTRQTTEYFIDRDVNKKEISRIGQVIFDVDVFFPMSQDRANRKASATSFLNSNISVEFFADTEYMINIDYDNRHKSDSISLGGRLDGHELSTFTLTVSTESYLITLQDMSSAKLYSVVGNTQTGLGTVTEIDLKKTPPIKYLPPRVPEQ